MSYSVFPEVFGIIIFTVIFMWAVVSSRKTKAEIAVRCFSFIALAGWFAFIIRATLIDRNPNVHYSVSLIPFKSYNYVLRQYNSMDVLMQIIKNILVFIPFGMLLPRSLNVKHKTKNYFLIIVAGAVFSGTVEILQHILSAGFTEADDVINNALGTMAGCGLYALTGKAEKKENSLELKKGWVWCLAPLMFIIVMLGVMWCYREYILFPKFLKAVMG